MPTLLYPSSFILHPSSLILDWADTLVLPLPTESSFILLSMFEMKDFTVGDRVRVVSLPPYVKTAEPMPMLRPPNVIQVGEEGVVIDRRPGGWGVRFSRGLFLMDEQYLEAIEDEG